MRDTDNDRPRLISAAEVAILVYSRLQGQQLRDPGTFSNLAELASLRH